MPDSRVDRLRLLCRAPHERSREAFALRERLDRVARLHLPAALERMFDGPAGRAGERRRVFVERLSVSLDVEPSDYDDVTLATLWAARVGQALEAERGAAEGIHMFEDDAAFVRSALSELLDHGRLSWWFEELVPLTTSSPFELLARLDLHQAEALVRQLAADAPTAQRLFASLRPGERQAVALALAGSRTWASLHSGAGRQAPLSVDPDDSTQPHPAPVAPERSQSGRTDGLISTDTEPEAVAHAWRQEQPPSMTVAAWVALLRYAARQGLRPPVAGAAPHSTMAEAEPTHRPAPGEPPVAEEPATGHSSGGANPGGEAPGAEPSATDASTAARERGDRQQTPLDADERTAYWTGAAGVVLLYPWLTHFLTEDVPTAASWGSLPAAVVARMLALGVIVAPGEAQPLRDPLVRLLAGAPPLPEEAGTPDVPFEGDAVHDAAAAVLTRFAGALPGFERSSAGYVRQHFIRRAGLVQPLAAGQVRVRPEPSPLDIVIERLPYPLVAFQFPWTPVVHIEVDRHA